MKNFIVMVVLVFTGSVSASGSVTIIEINHLLDFVRQTDCQFIRNGKSYSGKEAVEHIRKKYDYHKDKIDSAEAFIELSASKSMMSGKYYMISCGDKPKLKSRDYLLQELKTFRRKKSELQH